jgi:hypothetical protein
MPPTACPVLESERSPSFQGERDVLVRHGSLERLNVGKQNFRFCRVACVWRRAQVNATGLAS